LFGVEEEEEEKSLESLGCLRRFGESIGKTKVLPMLAFVKGGGLLKGVFVVVLERSELVCSEVSSVIGKVKVEGESESSSFSFHFITEFPPCFPLAVPRASCCSL
jgi:hypothetical protein